ncbi:APC family permease [Candidatus Acidianus copahuensis]|nr:APC family permease [Candidatus Acidianus copahuensis]
MPHLRKNSIRFLGMVSITVAGVLPIIGPIEVAPFISNASSAAIWPVILGYALFVLVSIPILEYTRLVEFAGGYYGLAEIGFGIPAGKFTALANYFFYVFWQTANAFFIGWLAVDTIYLIFHVLLPVWIWGVLVTLTLLVTYLMVIQPIEVFSRILTFTILSTLAVIVGFIVYIILKTPYNSPQFLNPTSVPFTNIALATAVLGFYTFTGYGSSLFYAEEGVKAKNDLWRAIYIGLSISAIVIALSAYSELASVPESELNSVSSSPLPQLVAWSHFVPETVLLGLNFLIIVVSLIAFGGGGGSQARLLWAMARDGFIRSKWLSEINEKGIPLRSATMNLIIALITVGLTSFFLLGTYGYSSQTVALAFYVAGTSSTILWYFHHFVPEFGLYAFLRKNNVNFSKFRKIFSGLIIPIGGMILFIYTFYQGILGDLVEPYLTFVIVSFILLLGDVVYVLYKRRKNSLGESTVKYMIAEKGKTSSENSMFIDNGLPLEGGTTKKSI